VTRREVVSGMDGAGIVLVDLLSCIRHKFARS
jgi:hypothetical protein